MSGRMKKAQLIMLLCNYLRQLWCTTYPHHPLGVHYILPMSQLLQCYQKEASYHRSSASLILVSCFIRRHCKLFCVLYAFAFTLDILPTFFLTKDPLA